ncbi:unnamed protein product [Larinioides sclopetarius]|uniref:LITAF domain-containing protein n=1 Tax=Larinioides sclopetarius TaxID=280406 RepID=A0AAV2A088_9ARAC
MVVPRCYQDISLRQTRNQMDSALQKKTVDKGVTFLLHTSYVEKVSFGREPAALVCKNCGQFIVTEISRHNGVCSFFTVLVTLFLCINEMFITEDLLHFLNAERFFILLP